MVSVILQLNEKGHKHLAKSNVMETQDCVLFVLVLLAQLMSCKLANLVGVLGKGALIN